MASPKFFIIESTTFPGYCLTQRGTAVVLSASNSDNPYQLWFKDDSWAYLTDPESNNPPFVLINNGSKKALKQVLEADSTGQPRAMKVSLATYDPSTEQSELFWSYTGTVSNATVLAASSSNPDLTLGLGVGQTKPTSADGIAAIVSIRPLNRTQWKFNEFAPPAYKIWVHWYNQVLTYKTPHQSKTWIGAPGTKNDEWNVAVVSSSNTIQDEGVWFKIPAGGLEDSNSSFVIVNKSTGKALKGSDKDGDKVIASEYDPLDNNFVWSEDRLITGDRNYVGVNISTNPKLHWYVTADGEYQNDTWYHTLTLRGQNVAGEAFLWKFDSNIV